MITQNTRRGGARDGAGRPVKHHGPTTKVSAILPAELVAQADQWAKDRDLSRSDALLEGLRLLVSGYDPAA